MDEAVDWIHSINFNITEYQPPKPPPSHALVLYGLLALFWFAYIFLLYRIWRYRVKERRKARKEADEQMRMRLEAARINAMSLVRAQKQENAASVPGTSVTLGNTDANSSTPALINPITSSTSQIVVEVNAITPSETPGPTVTFQLPSAEVSCVVPPQSTEAPQVSKQPAKKVVLDPDIKVELTESPLTAPPVGAFTARSASRIVYYV